MMSKKTRAKMVERGVSARELADRLGISRDSMYRKLREPARLITIREAKIIADALRLTEEEILEIFFGPEE